MARKPIMREGSQTIAISAYAPGNGESLSFVARYICDVPGHKRSEAAHPSPTEQECMRACPKGWTVHNLHGQFRAIIEANEGN